MKRLSLFILFFAIAVSVIACDLQSTTVTTTVTTNVEDIDDWVEVDSAAELIAADKDANIKLVDDIDLQNAEWVPFGNQSEPYSGVFDGNGHTIANFRITAKHDDFVGFFGVLTGTVFDLTIENGLVDYQTDFLTYAGLLAGYVSGDLENVSVSGIVRIESSQSNVFAGGLAGFVTSKVTSTTTATEFQATTLVDVVIDATIDVDAKNYAYVGGLAGKTYNVAIQGATVVSDITAANDQYRLYAGGLSGHNYSGLLRGFEHVLDSTDIVHEDIIVETKITALSMKGSVGGIYGLDSHGVLRRGAARSEFFFGETPLTAGGLAGESWSGQYHASAASLTFGTAIVDQPDYQFGGLVGRVWGTVLVSGGVYVYDGLLEPTTEWGTPVLLLDLQDPQYFEIDLEWGETDWAQSAAEVFLP